MSAQARDVAFAELEAAWVAKAPGRSAGPKSRAAFEAACAAGRDPAWLRDCGLAFLAESRDAKAGRAPMLHRWLEDERWKGFEPKPAASATAAPGWAGPAEIRAAAVGRWGEAFARSWIDPCGWDGDQRLLEARTFTAAERLRGDLGAELGRLGVGIVVKKREPA